MDAFTWAVIAQQQAWLDAGTDATGTELARLRILKLTEEIGEAAAAHMGFTGANPRKGVTHSIDDVAAELADVVITALVALATVTDDPGGALTARLTDVYTRSLQHGAHPLPPGDFEPDRAAWIASLPRVLAAATMLVTDEDGKALLVRHTYRKDGLWSWPGGGTDDGEPPRRTARREFAEELGLHIEPGPVLTVNWNRATDRPPIINYLFDGGTVTADQIDAIKTTDGEIGTFGFFAYDDALPMLSPTAQGELTAALQVRAHGGGCVCLEDGRPLRPAPGEAADDSSEKYTRRKP